MTARINLNKVIQLCRMQAVSDPIKPTSKEAVTKFKADNVKSSHGHADGPTTARAVALRRWQLEDGSW